MTASRVIRRGRVATSELIRGTFDALGVERSAVWRVLWERLTSTNEWNRLPAIERESMAHEFIDRGAHDLGAAVLRDLTRRSPDGTLLLAKALLLTGRFQDLFETLAREGDQLALAPKASLLAQANLALKRPVRAHWWLQQLDSSEIEPSELLAVADLAFSLGFRKVGRQTLQKGLENTAPQTPAHTQILGEGIRVSIAQKEVGLALELARELKEIHPESPWSSIWLGRALRLAGDLDAAWVEHERAVDLAPDLPTAWAELVKTLSSRGEPDERLRAAAGHLLEMKTEDEWPRQVAVDALASLDAPADNQADERQRNTAPTREANHVRTPSTDQWRPLRHAIASRDYETACKIERRLAGPWDARVAVAMANMHRSRGELSRALAVLDRVVSDFEITAELKERVEAELRALQSNSLSPVRRRGHVLPVRGRVIHMVGKSIPYVLSGYTVRTKYTVEAQREAGIESFVLTEPGFPWSIGEETAPLEEVIGEVPYLRVPKLSPPRDLDRTIDVVRRLAPAVLHAHSDFHNARRALAIGRALDLPVIYEVRGIWEETWVSKRGEEYRSAEYYRLRRDRETEAMAASDHVIVLNEQLKADISSRGIPTDRISVVPNAVDPERFPILRRDESLAARWGIRPDDVTLGYISSLVPYEGIDCLIRAIAELASEGTALPALVIGDGESRHGLENLARRLGVGDLVTFTGRVPHDEILSYYSLIDIFVIPRTSDRVSQLVTPLKPFEAMATGRALVVSGVAALREIIDEGVTGISYEPENPLALARVLKRLATDERLRAQLGFEAAARVREQHTWQSNALRYLEIYRKLGVA